MFTQKPQGLLGQIFDFTKVKIWWGIQNWGLFFKKVCLPWHLYGFP